MSSDTTESPYYIARGVVERVEQVSPSFVRVTFGGAGLTGFGNPGHVFDQRIKLIFPGASGVLPDLTGVGAEWYQAWLEIPAEERGSMRTYSIRTLEAHDSSTSVTIDFVLHLEPGLTGPASLWASGAAPGDELLIVGPRRGRTDGGGVEFDPGDAPSVLLAGDETAAPAIARILEDLPVDARGAAFIEVPAASDKLDIAAPSGFEVHWLPRNGASHGTMLAPAVIGVLGGAADAIDIRDIGDEELVWETPSYSGLGETLESHVDRAERYYWIAGESSVVTALRRSLVKELGIDRSQVAFMGYWRKGVAMRG